MSKIPRRDEQRLLAHADFRIEALEKKRGLMKNSLAVCAAVIMMFVLPGVTQAWTMYTVDVNGDFGKIDPVTGAYTQIAPHILGVATTARSLASDGAGGFYTTNGSRQLYSVTAAGVATPIGTNAAVGAYGLSRRASDGALYAYDRTRDSLGTINTATGAFVTIGNTGQVATSPYGRIAFLGDTLYGTFNSLGTFNLGTGLYTGMYGGGGYATMPLASEGSVLYGIYNGDHLISFDATFDLVWPPTRITGAAGIVWEGMASDGLAGGDGGGGGGGGSDGGSVGAPEPGTVLMGLSALAIGAGYRLRQWRRKRG